MSSERYAWLRYLSLTVVAVCLAIVVLDGVLGSFMVSALLGATGVAIALIAFKHRSGPAVQLADQFHDRPPSDVINISHVRVSGIGGLGLVLISALIAFEFPRIAVTLAVGLAGGLLLALFLIGQRRRHSISATGSSGPPASRNKAE